jgi:hypothetical protein
LTSTFDAAINEVVEEEKSARLTEIGEDFSDLDAQALHLFRPRSVEDARPEEEIRRAYMRHVLVLCDGSWTKASATLNVAVNTLRKWVEG